MKKKVFAAVLAVVAAFAMMSVSVLAVNPGDSDYEETNKVVVSEVKGDKVELTNTDTKTVVSVPKSALPENVTEVKFASKAVSDTAVVDAAKKAAGEKYTELSVFDMSMLDQDNNKIAKLNGKVSITVACPTGYNTVLYYNDATGKVENLGGTVKDGFITFETDHFSYYALAKTAKSNTPATGDTTMPIVLVVSVAVLAAAGLVVLKKTSKSK